MFFLFRRKGKAGICHLYFLYLLFFLSYFYLFFSFFLSLFFEDSRIFTPLFIYTQLAWDY